MDPETAPEPAVGLAPPDLALALAQASLATSVVLVPLGVVLLGVNVVQDPLIEAHPLDGLALLGPRARPLQLAGACLVVVACAFAWRRAQRAPAPWLSVADKSQLGAAGAVLGVWVPHLVLFALEETAWLGSPSLVLLGAGIGASLASAAAFRERPLGALVAGALGGGSGTLLGYFTVGCPMVLLAAPLAELLGVSLLVAIVGALANACIAGGALLSIRALAELFDLE